MVICFIKPPGALTKAEYQKKPPGGTPCSGSFPSAEGARRLFYQKTWYGDLIIILKFNDHFENSLIFYGAYSDIKNPTFRNYEARTETAFWERQYSHGNLQQ
jgi:iron complex outermembrane receptor protein